MSAKQNSFIINLIGQDRPGLVEELSREISEAGGNWESSRMARLAGQFAGMVHVVIPESSADNLKQRLEALNQEGLHVAIAAQGAEDEKTAGKRGQRCRLEVVGQDRSGIVSAITSVLAEAGVNVIEFDTDCSDAPMSGERLFKATAIISMPGDLDSFDLQEKLEAIANDLMVEIDLNCALPD